MPADAREDARSVQDAVRHSLEDVRRIAVELRPEALNELGLASALAVLCERFSTQLDLEVAGYLAPDLPPLPAEVELVVYRVAQEALTNVVRHAASSHAELTLTQTGNRLLLRIRDYGLGLPVEGIPGTGMRGMQERAALIGARLTIGTPRAASWVRGAS